MSAALPAFVRPHAALKQSSYRASLFFYLQRRELIYSFYCTRPPDGDGLARPPLDRLLVVFIK
jgi:hypothetical protein